jgi:hypothetical protein
MKKKKKQFEDYFQEATDVSGEQEQVVGKTFEEYLGIVDEKMASELTGRQQGNQVKNVPGHGGSNSGGNFKVNKEQIFDAKGNNGIFLYKLGVKKEDLVKTIKGLEKKEKQYKYKDGDREITITVKINNIGELFYTQGT